MEAKAQGGDEKFWEVPRRSLRQPEGAHPPAARGVRQERGARSRQGEEGARRGHPQEGHRRRPGRGCAVWRARTPYFFINGRQLRGAVPFASFKGVIDEELKTAETLVSQGVNKSQVYATVTKDGLTKAAPPKPREQKPRPGQPDPKATYKVPLEGNEPKRVRTTPSLPSWNSATSSVHSAGASSRRLRRSRRSTARTSESSG